MCVNCCCCCYCCLSLMAVVFLVYFNCSLCVCACMCVCLSFWLFSANVVYGELLMIVWFCMLLTLFLRICFVSQICCCTAALLFLVNIINKTKFFARGCVADGLAWLECGEVLDRATATRSVAVVALFVDGGLSFRSYSAKLLRFHVPKYMTISVGGRSVVLLLTWWFEHNGFQWVFYVNQKKEEK